jgi:hypothetical protein
MSGANRSSTETASAGRSIEKGRRHREVDKSLRRIVIGPFIVQAIVAYLLLHYGV